MVEVRKATIGDVEQIREIFLATYGDHYAYTEYYDVESLTRLVYADGSILLVAVEDNRVLGTASVVFGIGAYNDLVGEFGRLAVHPDARGKGVGSRLMEGRIERVKDRLHVGIVENRTTHTFSQRISLAHGFVPVGFTPMKLLLERRESVGMFVRHFGDALTLRRNNPRVIPEAGPLSHLALENCKLPADTILDDTSAPYPHDDDFELDELHTEGYSSLLRIERGRLRHREVFGPARLHYGLFQLRARHSHYLLARRDGQITGGVGFMLDEAERAVRIFELISRGDDPIRFLLRMLLRVCQEKLHAEFVEIDVSAYAPRMQRTLLELAFEPVGYVPAGVFHEVERLDTIKMVRLLVPFAPGEPQVCDPLRPIADTVLRRFATREALPRIIEAARDVPLFAGLNDQQRQQLLATCMPRTFEPGEPIFRQGDAGGSMHVILAGEVDLQTADPPRTIAQLRAGQCLGETSLLAAAQSIPPRSATAVARTCVESAQFAAGEFTELIRRRPDIGVILFRNLAADVSGKLKDTDARLS